MLKRATIRSSLYKFYFAILGSNDINSSKIFSDTFGKKKVLKISNSETNSQNNTTGRSVQEATEKVFEPEYFGDLSANNKMIMTDCDLYEKGFLATSLVKGHELNSEIKLRIYVPVGTKCVYMGNVNEEQGYYEVDVMHSSKLKIISMDKEYINCKLLETA